MESPTIPILVVDDEHLVLQSVSEILRSAGFTPCAVDNGTAAIEAVRNNGFEVAVIDVCMPGLSGFETAHQIKKIRPETEIIMMTGNPTLENSLAAIDEHIFAYLCKPMDLKVLLRSARSAAECFQLTRQNAQLIEQLEIERSRLQEQVFADRKVFQRQIAASPEFVGESELMDAVRRQIAEVAPSDMTVLIRGESGTGKDVVARLIGELSGRSKTGGFIKINCPAIPETLLESELFGHESGAFTGADRRKPGRFELAAEGTIFLDEIAEIPVTLQAKLLQVIEYKEFTRLGGTKTRTIKARIVTATNAPLESMISQGQFRSDLFYRLNEYSIVLPALRERPEDIPFLTDHFLKKHGATFQKPNLSLSPEIRSLLFDYAWPGNVRELEAVIRRFALTGSEETVRSALQQSGPQPQNIRNYPPAATQSTPAMPRPVSPPPPPASPPSNQMLRSSEIQTILRALNQTGWNRRKAAKILGTSYSTLRRKIANYSINKSTDIQNDTLTPEA